MKKILSFLLVFVLFLCNVSFASATGEKHLYFETEDTSEVDKYVMTNIYELLLGQTDNNIEICQNVKLGGGIKVQSQSDDGFFLYPLYYNNKVIYVCRVYYDGQEFSSVLSEGLAEEFNQLKSSENIVYSLAVSNDNLVLFNDDYQEVWAKDMKANKQYSENEIMSFKKMKKTNNRKSINIYLNITKKVERAIESRAYYNLAIDYVEQQISLPWCAGYVGANIIRYMTGNSFVYASTIAQFGSVSSTSGIPRSVVKNYARAFAGITVREYNAVANLTYSVIEGQLKLKQPIYGAFHKNGNTSSRHAIVVHGINGGTVKVRNPWYKKSETYPLTNYAYVAENGSKWIQDGYMSFTK